MLVAVGKIVLDFYNNDDLNLKRKHLQQLCDEVRKKFNMSLLEVAEFDDTEKCVLGFAVVIPESWKTVQAHKFVEKICKTIDTTAFARVIVEDWEFLGFGDTE